MLMRFFAAATLVMLASCNQEAGPSLERGWAPPGACVFVGNRADSHSCATTGTQLLANPMVYDGRRISVRGWGVVGRDHSDRPVVWLYLTQDAVETTATHSVVVLKGQAVGAIAAYLERQNQSMEPRLLGVTGDFEVFKPDASGSRKRNSVECCRFGMLRNVTMWGP
ncbi:hypothetical protein GCM10007067_12400 [Lysobacter bugurensis]|uniref:Lipoprotein n=1 Tax=Cognatilysobacter bugurensis TaxID=543356 RepID=A0A918SZH0_9GAMM|nr:hypothetical protein GCM10007067_12400 [Lysobacter bugurensis]